MPTEGPAQCLSQRLSLRLQYCLQESCCNSLCRGSMWHQRTARPLAAQLGTQLKHPGCSDGTHVFKKAHWMQLRWKYLDTVVCTKSSSSFLECPKLPVLLSLRSAPGPRPIRSIFQPAKPTSILSAISRIAPKTPTRQRRRWPPRHPRLRCAIRAHQRGAS